MILLGIEKSVDTYSELVEINTIEEISKLSGETLAIIDFSMKDLERYKMDSLLGVRVHSVVEFVLLMQTGVKFAICEKELASKLQKCADSYLSDTKVISLISNIDEIEWATEREIDGVLGSWSLKTLFS